MKTTLLDSLDEADARKLDGCKVVDESGESIGTVDGLWIDSTSRRVEFVGVKSDSFSGKVHLVPAGEAEIVDEGYLIKLRYRGELIAKAPSFFPGAGRSEQSTDRKELEKSFCASKMKLKHGIAKTGSRAAHSIKEGSTCEFVDNSAVRIEHRLEAYATLGFRWATS